MATPDLLPSPVSRTVTEPIVVESSDSEDEREPQRKRRRTYSGRDSSSDENVIDLTEVDEQHNATPPEDHIRFQNFLPKLIRLTPFRFSEDDEEDSTIVRLESLRDHLQKFFSRPEDFPQDIGSPINPDELEIIGVKSTPISTSPSSSSRSLPPPRTTTSSTSTTSKEKGKTAQQSGEKDNNGGPMSLECAICLGQMKGITATTCGHIFCLECIRKAIQVTKCCPLCKKKLTLKQIHPLYL